MRRARSEGSSPSVTLASDGWPIPLPVAELSAAPDGFVGRIPRLPPSVALPVEGPACISFQTHAEKFVGQDNAAFVGRAVTDGDDFHLVVERRLGAFALGGGRLRRTSQFLAYGRRLRPRLEAECVRRGQSVPRARRTDVV